MRKAILLLASIFVPVTIFGNNQSPIIPEPVEIKMTEGHFTIDEETSEDEGILCPECGEGIIEDTEDCAFCPECFYSPCE